MLSRRIWLVAILLLLPGALPVMAQDGGAVWQVTDVAPLALPEAARIPLVLPAPDGQHALYDRGDAVCRFDVQTGAEECLQRADGLPRVTGVGPAGHRLAAWSPDAYRLAVIGMPGSTLMDTDVWIADFDAGTQTVLTDDGFEGSISDRVPGTLLDLQPTWSPDGTQIVLERTAIGQDGRFESARLVVVDVESGAVRDLGPLPGHETHEQDVGTTLDLAWSPDGTTLAAAFRHIPEPDYAVDGLWLVDVAGAGEMTQVLDWRAVEAALAALYPQRMALLLNGLQWSSDGARLLFRASDLRSYPMGQWMFWVELDSAEIVPIPLPAHPRDNEAVRMIWPMMAVWSPDGQALLVAARENTHPSDEAVIALDAAGGPADVSLRVIDVASREGQLLGHLPNGLSMQRAIWADSGDVIINGYHLILAEK